MKSKQNIVDLVLWAKKKNDFLLALSLAADC